MRRYLAIWTSLDHSGSVVDLEVLAAVDGLHISHLHASSGAIVGLAAGRVEAREAFEVVYAVVRKVGPNQRRQLVVTRHHQLHISRAVVTLEIDTVTNAVGLRQVRNGQNGDEDKEFGTEHLRERQSVRITLRFHGGWYEARQHREAKPEDEPHKKGEQASAHETKICHSWKLMNDTPGLETNVARWSPIS